MNLYRDMVKDMSAMELIDVIDDCTHLQAMRNAAAEELHRRGDDMAKHWERDMARLEEKAERLRGRFRKEA